MDDLISRAAALNAIDCWHIDFNSIDGAKVQTDCWRTIKELPAVDAVPVVHARWRELKDGSEECTNCLGLCPHEENYNGDVIFNFGCEYCPWCGAKMKEDE
jgi:hypothetical protein